MADEYERAYLGGGEAIHREKRVSRQTFGILMGIAAMLGVGAMLCVGAFVSGDPQGLGGAILLGGIGALNAALGVALSVTRTVVTPRELRFMVGIRNRAIPLASITSTAVHTLRPPALRADVAKDGAELSGIFGAGDYVRVAYTVEGAARVVWIGSDDAEVLLGAIDRARTAAAPPKTRVEVAEEVADHESASAAEKAISRRSP